QVLHTQRFQHQMARLQPRIKELEEEVRAELRRRYRNDEAAVNREFFTEFNRRKTEFLLRNGVNPLRQMRGCLLVFLQMPIFMGLYYALKESVHFRLQPFLWIQNLAAPDMLVYWGENIPFISQPQSQGGLFYLGPFFNLLPIIATGLMLLHQKQTMPPPTDE